MTSLDRIGSANPLITVLTLIGLGTLRLLGNFGALAIFFFMAFINIFRRKQLREIVNQVFYIGARSSLIVMLVGLFTGMVLGLQLFYTLVKFGAVGALGSAVSLSLVREMGPVLTAIMITARAGSGMSRNRKTLRAQNSQLYVIPSRELRGNQRGGDRPPHRHARRVCPISQKTG